MRTRYYVAQDYWAGLTSSNDWAVYPPDAEQNDLPPIAVFASRTDARVYARTKNLTRKTK